MIDLDNIEKREFYQVPDNYFEELPGRVMQKIKHEKNKRRTVISSAIAAVAIVAVALGVFFTFNTPKQSTEITQAQQIAATTEEQEALETVAADYYSEELALMDYYLYAEY